MTRLLTLTVAMSMSVPISNVTWICTTPFDAEFELMYCMPGMPLMLFSSGEATVSSTTCAEAPG